MEVITSEVKEQSLSEDALVEKAYRLAKMYAPKIMVQYGVREKFSEEDLVQSFIVKFIEKGFATKYDASKASFSHYVYVGLRNIAISMFRSSKFEMETFDGSPSIDKDASDNPSMSGVEQLLDKVSGRIHLVLHASPLTPLAEDALLDTILSSMQDFSFLGKQVTLEVGGEDPIILRPKASSVAQMLTMGYSQKEMAIKFGVTYQVIKYVMKKIRRDYKRNKACKLTI